MGFVVENRADHINSAHGRDFPGGAVVKTPGSQCRGHGFDPWSGSHMPHSAAKKTPPNKHTKKTPKTT